MSNKTKIICTLGPASCSVKTLIALIENGMDAARLNFSHGDHETHYRNILNVREASKISGYINPIIMDLQGPKIRVGKLSNGAVELIKDMTVRISQKEIEGNNEVFSTSYKNLINDLKSGDFILLDDGLLKLQVTDKNNNEVNCKIQKGGILKERKGINLPHTDLKLPSLSEKDLSDIEFGIKNSVDMIALSFVRKPEDVLELKSILKKNNTDIPVISKIERPEAINKIDEIIEVSDAIMVARGDLGVEISPEEVPILQKMIIKKCNRELKPVITATQMLESMVTNQIPSRAEASDVANAILDGTDCVMLSAETSIGYDPVNVVKTMERIIAKTEFIKKPNFFDRTLNNIQLESICHSATELANRINAKCIVTITRTGKSPLYLSSHRIQAKIISASKDKKINKFNQIVWGVKPYYMKNEKNLNQMFNELTGFIVKSNFAAKGDKVIFIYNKSTDEPESADTISVVEI
jgi:pyruvate kinase